MTLVGEMAETVIHDLRNPCHTILVSSELITKDHADERTRRACKIIQEQIQRMTSMVEEIQEFSRGTHQLNRQTTSLTALLEEFAFLNRDYLQQNSIELDLRPVDVALHVDAGKLLRVLQNLVYNAAEALEGSAGKIIISGRILGGEVEICVRDNGPGIPEHIKDSLFEPFVTFGKNSGTGLGLAIAKSIVEAHGGHILYDPKRGDGAAFYVRLPRG